MKKCESCGKTFSENKDVFCPHCGAVAEKKCTHGSSFDSSRWNRGEIYGNDNRNTYRGGVEPHVQRTEENAEKRQDKRYLNPTVPFDGKSLKKIIGIVVIIIVCINLIVGFTNFVLTKDDLADEQWAESIVSGEFGYYPTIGNAQVEVENVGADRFVFKLKADDFYFINIDEEGSKEIADDLFNYEQYAEIEASVFYETEMYSYEYESELENYTYLSSDSADGYYEFYDYEFRSGDIIYLSNFYIGTENSSLYPELPFDAFCCDDDGDVTYYRVSEEQYYNDEIVFEECEPSAAVDSYDMYISLENMEVEFFENTEVTENYTEVVSVVGENEEG